MQPLKIAILSTSRIVEEFLQHLAEMPEISVQALCCRPQSGDKARAWAQQYGVPAVYTDEDACYAAGGFDAVYIGTANHLHYAAAKRALQAGYSVILEKPFTGTAAAVDHALHLLGLRTDSMAELNYQDRKRVHNLKYYTWVEQQGRTAQELNDLWYGTVWDDVHRQADQLDALINAFNEEAGVLKTL